MQTDGKGIYVLILYLPSRRTIRIGRLGEFYFPDGYYAYVGSAMGGLKARISRHLRGNKKSHWHIDYLLQRASVNSIIICETEERVECTIARALSFRLTAIPGFGSTDCRCPSHLFYADRENNLAAVIRIELNELNIKPRAVKKREVIR